MTISQTLAFLSQWLRNYGARKTLLIYWRLSMSVFIYFLVVLISLTTKDNKSSSLLEYFVPHVGEYVSVLSALEKLNVAILRAMDKTKEVGDDWATSVNVAALSFSCQDLIQMQHQQNIFHSVYLSTFFLSWVIQTFLFVSQLLVYKFRKCRRKENCPASASSHWQNIHQTCHDWETIEKHVICFACKAKKARWFDCEEIRLDFNCQMWSICRHSAHWHQNVGCCFNTVLYCRLILVSLKWSAMIIILVQCISPLLANQSADALGS